MALDELTRVLGAARRGADTPEAGPLVRPWHFMVERGDSGRLHGDHRCPRTTGATASQAAAIWDLGDLLDGRDACVCVDDAYLRMLHPHEMGAAMAFPADYVVLGNQTERARQYGNAVTVTLTGA